MWLSLWIVLLFTAIVDCHVQLRTDGADQGRKSPKKTKGLQSDRTTGDLDNGIQITRNELGTDDEDSMEARHKKRRRYCVPSPFCTKNNGYCVKKRKNCNGEVKRRECCGSAKKCLCCIPVIEPLTTLDPKHPPTTTPADTDGGEKSEGDSCEITEPVPYAGYQTGHYDRIWNFGENEEIKSLNDTTTETIEECQILCDCTGGCNAIIYDEETDECVTLSSPIPIPQPNKKDSSKLGYIKLIATPEGYEGPVDAGWSKQQCKALAVIESKTLTECFVLCDADSRCNAFTYKSTHKTSCRIRECPTPIPEPNKADTSPNYVGYKKIVDEAAL